MSPVGGVSLRPGTLADAPAVAVIWHAGWQDGHLGHVPEDLLAARTERSFSARALQRVDDTAVAEVDGEIAGFVMVVDDEVEQVYVAEQNRGSAVASTLLAEAERQVREAGHDTAWLAVVAGNVRARRFYARCGWSDEGPFDHQAPGPGGPIRVPSHRYTKAV